MGIGPSRSFHILLIEDNEGDSFLFRKALKNSGFNVHAHIVPGAKEVSDLLRPRGKELRQFVPDLIVLDLGLPGEDGYEVLRTLKTDPELKVIPVIIFTGSDAPDGVRRAYELGANSYIVKRIGFEELQRSVNDMLEFWLGLASLPTDL